jgi:SAM-dependent methyltransferase
MKPTANFTSLLDYYLKNRFNPVPISIEDGAVWEDHVAKRRNLYDHHLGAPLSLLRGKSVIEFGCNSGENSLVLAKAGASLTLVEPNEQVLPRLKELFSKFKLSGRISSLENQGITEFETDARYDMAIAEGFLFALPNRDALVEKICGLLSPGGIGVISFNDRYGVLIELIKRLFLWRACELADVDAHSEESLAISMALFGEDFEKLNKSRPIKAWWKDTLVQPFIVDEYFWSYQEIIPILEKSGAEFLSSSPRWALSDSFNWYKNRSSTRERHDGVLEDWRAVFPYIITGRREDALGSAPAGLDVISSAASLVRKISDYASEKRRPGSLEEIEYPEPLDRYLNDTGKAGVKSLNHDIKALIEAVKRNDFDELIAAYKQSTSFRGYWGSPYHYISFMKSDRR